MRSGGLFAGYGGLDMAVSEVFGSEPAWFSEIEPAPSAILAHHWPDVPNHGDITKIDWATVERVEILTGGFPCQDVSPAGLRAGFTPDSRSGLWSQFALAISKLRPRYVVIENVRGLLSARGAKPTEELMLAWAEIAKCARVLSLLGRKHRRAVQEGKEFYVQRHATDRIRFMGRQKQAVAAARRADARIVRAIGTVLGDLADLGYDAQWCGLRAADVGAPHGRYRIFILARDAAVTDGQHDGNTERAIRNGHRFAPTDARGEALGLGSGLRTGEPTGQRWGRPDDHAAQAATDSGSNGRQWRTELDRGTVGGIEASLGYDADGCADAAADPSGEGLQESEGIARGLQAALPAVGRAGDLTADTSSNGRHQGRPEPAGELGGPDAAERSASPTAWGQYGPAIERWERVLGRVAPAPTEPGAKGGQRLAPRFVEWMQGLPAGHVTAVPGVNRNAQLKALGNGVVPQQAAAALRALRSAALGVPA